jgi:hypothetical protein
LEHGDFLFYTIKNTDYADRIQNDIIHRLIE